MDRHRLSSPQVQLTEALRFDAADVYSVSAYIDYHTADPLVDAVRPLDGILDISCGHQPERHDAVDGMVRSALAEAARTCVEIKFQAPYAIDDNLTHRLISCLLYTSPSPRDQRGSRMPSSA